MNFITQQQNYTQHETKKLSASTGGPVASLHLTVLEFLASVQLEYPARDISPIFR